MPRSREGMAHCTPPWPDPVCSHVLFQEPDFKRDIDLPQETPRGDMLRVLPGKEKIALNAYYLKTFCMEERSSAFRGQL